MEGKPVDLKSFSAFSATTLISEMLAVQHEKEQHGHFDWLMIILAIVVFPQPGGPVRIKEGGGSFSSNVLTILPCWNSSEFPYKINLNKSK